MEFKMDDHAMHHGEEVVIDGVSKQEQGIFSVHSLDGKRGFDVKAADLTPVEVPKPKRAPR